MVQIGYFVAFSAFTDKGFQASPLFYFLGSFLSRFRAEVFLVKFSIIPFILVFALLIACIFPVQVSAASLGHSTTIQIGSQSFKFSSAGFSSPDVTMVVTSSGCTFTSPGTVGTKTYTYSGSGSFQGFAISSNGSAFYTPGNSYTLEGESDDPVYVLYPVSGDSVNLLSIIKIDGTNYTFLGETSQPSVILQVTSTGAKLSYGSQSQTYVYSGSGQFAGFSKSSGGSVTYSPGQTYALTAGDHTLYPCSVSYLSTIKIDGTNYTFLGDSSKPPVTLQVTSSGAVLSYGSQSQTYVYSGSGQFTGFSTTAFGAVTYSPGQTYTLPAGDRTLYPCSVSYLSTITIDGKNYAFLGDNSKPTVTLQVTSTGAVLSYGDQSQTYTYSGSGQFSGFSKSSGGSVAYSPGQTYTLTAGDHTLYPRSVSYLSTIKIDGTNYAFLGDNSKPSVTLQVTSTGAVLSYGSQTQTYTYSGSGIFDGFSKSSGGVASYLPGQTYTLSAGDHVLYAVSHAPAPLFTATVYIGSDTFSFPVMSVPFYVTLSITESGAELSAGGVSYTYVFSGDDVFAGLSFVAGSDPVLVPGDQTTIEFTGASDSSVIFYPCSNVEGGVLEILQSLYKKFTAWLDGSLSIPEVTGALKIIDFGSIIDFFGESYQQVKSMFGLLDLFDDPSGPFYDFVSH